MTRIEDPKPLPAADAPLSIPDLQSSAQNSPPAVLTIAVESTATTPAPVVIAEISASPPGPIAQSSAERKEKPATGLKRQEAKAKLEALIRKLQIQVIAIGNGTACRETEEFVADVIATLEKGKTPSDAGGLSTAGISEEPMKREMGNPGLESGSTGEGAETPFPVLDRQSSSADLPKAPADLAYVIVNEAGASVYSASAVGREEFPTYDATLRGTISIGRRLQDPLSELVKVDPRGRSYDLGLALENYRL